MAHRTTYATLSELIACHAIFAGQVFANTLVFEQLYAAYLEAEWEELSPTRNRPVAVQALQDLRDDVRRLIWESEQLLLDAGGLGLGEIVERRARIESNFTELMKTAGVIHDAMCVMEGHSSLDLVRARRRLEVTDQHAQDIVERIWDVVAQAYDGFSPNKMRPLFDFRHTQDVQTRLKSLYCYVNIPFWMLYMPRICACGVAHECAHPIVTGLQYGGWDDIDRATSDLSGLNEKYYFFDDSTTSDKIKQFVVEVFVDTLAAMVLGPAYIVGIAETLIGTRKKSDTHLMRIGTLLRLQKEGAFTSAHRCDGIAELLASVQNMLTDQRKGKLPGIANAIDFIEHHLAESILRFITRMTPEQRARLQAARMDSSILAFNDAWSAVAHMTQSKSGLELKQALQDDIELGRFIDTPSDVVTGESWSLEWLSFRTRKSAAQEVPYENLANWMRSFAPPTPVHMIREGQTPAYYGIVLGASDAFVLRPHLRVRAPALFNLDSKDELCAFAERRVLIEIVGIRGESEPVGSPDWSKVCYLTEMKLAPRQKASLGEFLRSFRQHAAGCGISLVRAYLGLGWASVVVLLAPSHIDGWWQFRREFLGNSELAPEISISSLICSSSFIDPNHPADLGDPNLELANPWTGCKPSTKIVTFAESFLRAREVYKLTQPTLSYGIYGAIERTEDLQPERFDKITEKHYSAMRRGELSRTVSVIAHNQR